jgi:hypothetical protein
MRPMGRFSRLRRGSGSGEDDPPADATVEFDVTRDQAVADAAARGATDATHMHPSAAAEDTDTDGSHTPASYRDRARLRRRLRYLRRARELSFRDLGGFVFDAHRFDRNRDDIVAAKLKGLAGMDAELRSLETALDDRRELMLLHEPGISVCPRCAALHASDANFCSGCGLPRRGAALPLGPRAPLPVSDAAASEQPTTVSPSPKADFRPPFGTRK